MKKAFPVLLTTALLLTGCSSGSDTYDDFDDLTKALRAAGIKCETGATVTQVDFEGTAKTCNSAQIMYLFPDPEYMEESLQFHDITRQGIFESHWVVGENWYVITNEENASKIAKKAGGEVTIIGSK